MFDIEGAERYIAGYEKIPDENGEYDLAVEYLFQKPVPLSLLQNLFNVDPNDPDEGERYLIDCCMIEEKHAAILQQFVKEKLDLTKYTYMLECRALE